MGAGIWPVFRVMHNVLTAPDCAELAPDRADVTLSVASFVWRSRSPSLAMLSQLVLFHASLDFALDAHEMWDWTLAPGPIDDDIGNGRGLSCVVHLDRDPLSICITGDGIEHLLILTQGDALLFTGLARISAGATVLTTTLFRFTSRDDPAFARGMLVH